MKKIVLVMTVVGILTLPVAALEIEMTKLAPKISPKELYVHIDKKNEKILSIDKNSTKNEDEEILIISSANSIKIERGLKAKDENYAICASNPPEAIKATEDKLCSSIFGTTTSSEAIKANATTGVISNVILGVISLGIVPAMQGVTYSRYLDNEKLNKFIDDNNLKICFYNLQLENEFVSKYVNVAEYIKSPIYNQSSADFMKHLNEQEDKIAVMSKNINSLAKGLIGGKTEKDIKEAHWGDFGKSKVSIDDGFGEQKEIEVCNISLLKENVEIANVYKRTWRNKAFNQTFDNTPYSKNSIQIEPDFAMAQGRYSVLGPLFGDLKINTQNVQANKIIMTSEVQVWMVNYQLEKFLAFRGGEKLDSKRVKLLQAVLAAAKIIEPESRQGCRYWPEYADKIPNHVTDAIAKHKNNKIVIKFLSFFMKEGISASEKIKAILEIEDVKQMFDIINS